MKFNNIPRTLKRIDRWMLWSYNQQQRKIPKKIDNSYGSAPDRNSWFEYYDVEDAYSKNQNIFSGLGFAFSSDDNIIGIDIDDCVDESGTLSDLAKQILDKVQGYAEVSPSGTGIKIFTRALAPRSFNDSQNTGIEVYGQDRYFTVTGNVIDTHTEVPNDLQDIHFIYDMVKIEPRAYSGESNKDPVPDYDIKRVENEILPHFPSDTDYNSWIEMGMILYHQFDGDIEALELFDRWSYNNGNTPTYVEGDCEAKWATFGKPHPNQKTLASLIYIINQREKEKEMAEGGIVVETGNYNNYADKVLEYKFTNEEGFTLARYNENWYTFDKISWKLKSNESFDGEVHQVLSLAKRTTKDGLTPLNPTLTTVANTVLPLKFKTMVETNEDNKIPTWINQPQGYPEAQSLVHLQNGLLDIKTRQIFPHTKDFFSVNPLTFEYDKEAQCPRWNQFLKEVWGEDQESIDCLQEIFGYILTGETTQQKFFYIRGPKRAGKGTISSILQELMGLHNCVAPQLSSFSGSFALQSWINKPLALFNDARMPSQPSDTKRVVEEILTITGEDVKTVDIKNKPHWIGKLPARIIMFSNDYLKMTESSSALTGRMIMLSITTSQYGKEDTSLLAKLQNELPGIFNWALDGNDRRLARGGKFIQPESAENLIEEVAKLSNPLTEFVQDYLEIDPFAEVDSDVVYNLYQYWMRDENNRMVKSKANFTSELKQTLIDHNITTQRKRIKNEGDSDNRKRFYVGIRLSEFGEEVLEELQTGFGNL